MSTLFLSITHGFQARDLLRTAVLPELLASGVHVVILTPNSQDEYFRREFAHPNISIEPLSLDASRLELAMAAFRRYALANLRLNRTINALTERFLRSRAPKHVVLKALNSVLGRWKPARKLWRAIEGMLFSGREYDGSFERYRPSLVVTGTAGSIPADAHLIRAARRYGSRTACVVLSWDNLTSKGHMAAVPDELIVWNEIMRREAIELHDYSPSRVHVAGVAHFDIYAQPSAAGSRDVFCRALGLEPDRRILVLGTVTPWLFPFNRDIAEILAEAIRANALRYPCQLVIRLHPQVVSRGTPHAENIEAFEVLARTYPHVVLDRPRVRSESLMWDVATDDMAHLADLLRYADVTLNAGSTLTIDSAIVDTPVVNIAFDGYATRPPAESVRRIYDFTHYVNIVRSGGVRLAGSAEAMIEEVNAYLSDPSRDRDGRARIVREQCYLVDGHSASRVARLLSAMMEPASRALLHARPARDSAAEGAFRDAKS